MAAVVTKLVLLQLWDIEQAAHSALTRCGTTRSAVLEFRMALHFAVATRSAPTLFSVIRCHDRLWQAHTGQAALLSFFAPVVLAKEV